jgi:hypothetical protein
VEALNVVVALLGTALAARTLLGRRPNETDLAHGWLQTVRWCRLVMGLLFVGLTALSASWDGPLPKPWAEWWKTGLDLILWLYLVVGFLIEGNYAQGRRLR